MKECIKTGKEKQRWWLTFTFLSTLGKMEVKLCFKLIMYVNCPSIEQLQILLQKMSLGKEKQNNLVCFGDKNY